MITWNLYEHSDFNQFFTFWPFQTASGTIETYYAEDGDEGLSGEVEYSLTPVGDPHY